MTMQMNLSQMSGSEIGRAISEGLTDSISVCEYFLTRIETYEDPKVFLTVTKDRALKEATESQKRYKDGNQLGPLDGVPISWKDLFNMAGTKTTAGSELLRETPRIKQDAPVVANLAAAGMVCLGKVNLTEFAYSGLGLNPHYGTPFNPNDKVTPRAPGGSSSGSGVCVASGLSPCSMGTDTGGSVRIPAAFNGIVGFKTSEGHIDKTGVYPLSDTLDTVGPLTRSVEDAVHLNFAMRGLKSGTTLEGDLTRLTMVIPENIVLDDLEKAVGNNFDLCLDALSKAGVTIKIINLQALSEVQELTAKFGSITAAEAYFVHQARVDSELVDKMDSRVVDRIMGGKNMSAHDLVSLEQNRKRLIAELQGVLEGAMLVMPTTPIVAPEIAPLEADKEYFHKVNLMALRNTMLGNFLQTCGVAMPSGKDEKEMPTSILFSGFRGDEEKILSYSLSIEKALSGIIK